MVTIWIDGASRNNGKPHCISTGGIYIEYGDGTYETGVVHEFKSTSQRGELQGVIVALSVAKIIKQKGYDDFMFVTDSEYAFNTITKEWYKNWIRKGWITAVGEPVKNKDLWLIISDLLNELDESYSFTHIKGHVVSIGKLTAATILAKDISGASLRTRIDLRYPFVDKEKIDEAKSLFLKNHGYEVDDEIFRKLVVGNIVADCVATAHADYVSIEFCDDICLPEHTDEIAKIMEVANGNSLCDK